MLKGIAKPFQSGQSVHLLVSRLTSISQHFSSHEINTCFEIVFLNMLISISEITKLSFGI